MRQKNWQLDSLAAQYHSTAANSLPLVIETNHIEERPDQNWTDRGVVHRHLNFAALIVVRRGRGQHLLNGTAYGVSRGDVYIMGEGMAHQWEKFEDLVINSFYFSPQLFDTATLEALRETPGFLPLFVRGPERLGSEGEGRRWLHLTPDEHLPIEAEIAELTAEWEVGTPLGVLLTRSLFLRLLAHLARIFTAHQGYPEISPASTSRQGGARAATVAAALGYMEAHFTEEVRIESIAASVFLSPAHFREVFAQAMGRTPRDYLRLLRVERAKTLLATTDQPMTEIGLASGLSDPGYFARVFRAETGMTPREYRRKAGGHGE